MQLNNDQVLIICVRSLSSYFFCIIQRLKTMIIIITTKAVSQVQQVSEGKYRSLSLDAMILC